MYTFTSLLHLDSFFRSVNSFCSTFYASLNIIIARASFNNFKKKNDDWPKVKLSLLNKKFSHSLQLALFKLSAKKVASRMASMRKTMWQKQCERTFQRKKLYLYAESVGRTHVQTECSPTSDSLDSNRIYKHIFTKICANVVFD